MASRIATKAAKATNASRASKPTKPTSLGSGLSELSPDAWLAARTASALESAQRDSIVGVVVSAGRMDRAVKVQTTKQRFDTHLRRNYTQRQAHLVSDPRGSLREGDVVRIAPWQMARRISHIVTEIIKPFGDGKGGDMTVEERPAVMGIAEVVRVRHEAWVRKQERRKERKEAEEEEEERRRLLLAEEEAEASGAKEVRGEGESEMATRLERKKNKLAGQGLEMEAEAEEIERRAVAKEGEGVDLEKRKEEMRSS